MTVPNHHGADPVLRHMDSDMDKVVTGLYMLEKLLPGPLSPLPSPGSIYLHGEIFMDNKKTRKDEWKGFNEYQQTGNNDSPFDA